MDYRRLNKFSHTDSYPMPRVDDLIDKVGQANYISTIDLTRGYRQVPVAVEDTAFATSFGLYQFNVMPFGLVEAHATFQRLMDHIMQNNGLNNAHPTPGVLSYKQLPTHSYIKQPHFLHANIYAHA